MKQNNFIPSRNRCTRADYARKHSLDWHLVNHWVAKGHLRKCVRDGEIYVDSTQPIPVIKQGRPTLTLKEVKARAMANVKKSIEKFKERNK